MSALYLLSLLRAVGMAEVVISPSGHHCVSLLDRPYGTQVELVQLDDKNLEVHLKAHLEEAIEYLGLSAQRG